MKNVVLVDFTPESIEALTYAIDFTKVIKGKLEILNVSDSAHNEEAREKIEALKTKYSDGSIEINAVELVGDVEEALTEYVNGDNIGIVFSGTHPLKIMENFFSSRALHLLNEVKANFLFVPHNLKKYSHISKVLVPVVEDKQSLQNIEVLRFLHHFMKFEIVLGTYRTRDSDVKRNLIVASKLLQNAGIKYSVETLGSSENSLKSQLTDLAKIEKAEMISIVNLTEENFFNGQEKSFVDDLIRNESGFPILVIQNQNTAQYSGFHTAGGY